jgi:hypothetical protein
MIEDELQRPGFQRVEPHFREERQGRAGDQNPLSADVGPAVQEDSPEAGQVLMQRLRTRINDSAP